MAESETRAILLIDHGSRSPAAHSQLIEVAQLVRERLGDGSIVEVAHMEIASPDIEEGFAACVRAGADHIVAMPYMISAGRHATEDIPAMVAEAAKTHEGVGHETVAPLGIHPLLAEIVLDRCGHLPSDR